MKVFVTGGTGLIGSHLLVELVQRYPTVTAIFRDATKIKTVKSIFAFYLGKQSNQFFQRINWISCDILDIPTLEDVMKGHTHVYHCAAIVSFERRDFSRMMKVNREGTANIVNVCLHHNVEQLIYVSSTAAVGNKDVLKNELITEEGKWILTDETSGYSISKYSAEKEVWRGVEEGLDAIIVNPSIVIGAGNWNESSLKIFRTISTGLKFYSPGSNAFVDARDVAQIMVQLSEKKVINERFLCIGENTSFKQLFELIAKELGVKAPKYKVNKLLMGIAWRISVLWSVLTFTRPTITRSSALSAFKHAQFDASKVKNKLNYSFYTLEESVKNAVEGKVV